MEMTPGLVGNKDVVVTEDLTAQHLGSGRVMVLATPAMIMLMEQAALEAVESRLSPGQQTVGIHVDVHHLAATPLGMTVHVRAELREIDGRRLVYHVAAFDAKEKIGEGLHERMIINVERFERKVRAKGDA